MQLTKESTRHRLVYPDVLRATATIYVIMLHICGGEMWRLTPEMWQFKWLAAADALTHCAVPLFLMLSGMFLLSPEKDITLTRLFKKYILRLVIAYVGWSAFYSVFTGVCNNTLLSENPYDLWKRFIDGHYHLGGFIPKMIGVYLTVPFLKAVTDKKDHRQLYYVMALCCCFAVIKPNIREIFPTISGILDRIDPSGSGIYVAYFFFGYFFSQVKVSRNGKYVWLRIMAGSAIWVICSVFSGSAELGVLDESKWSANRIPMVIYTVSSFMTFRNFGNNVTHFPRAHHFLNKVSELSFVVYLCHAMIISILAKLGFTSLTWHPVISVPVLTCVVLICSMLFAYALVSLAAIMKRVCYNSKTKEAD